MVNQYVVFAEIPVCKTSIINGHCKKLHNKQENNIS